MPVYLSEEWIQEADAALRTSGMCTEDGERFAVEQRVDEVVFHMVFDGDGARVGAGSTVDPAVVLSQSRDTAAAIARGELSAEEAMLNGWTVVDGNPLALLSHHKILARANDVFADIRSRTDWS